MGIVVDDITSTTVIIKTPVFDENGRFLRVNEEVIEDWKFKEPSKENVKNNAK